MFKKTRWKIVATVMTVLVLLWVGTLGVIYASSYYEMKMQNQRMLRAHAELYAPGQGESKFTDFRPKPDGARGRKPDFDPNSPQFHLSTFYTVALSPDGEVLETRNEFSAVHTDKELEEMAKRIVADGKESGSENNLTFFKADKGSYVLVAFMDNTVVNESAMTLFRYTLIFGGAALVLFFFLSVFLARKIVDPLEESYQKQKQFISDAGHELKTPVSVVNANAELLSRQIGDNQWLSNIRYENERMRVLITQLLDLARTENAAPQTEAIDFSRLVAGEALPFESVAFEKGLVLNTRIANGIGTNGNSTQLKQLVSILLDNAIRHSKEQGEVLLTLTRERGFAKLSVINRGDEIPIAERTKIFQRFYRMDPARNGEDGHYGLGLSIARAITQSHKGQIEVHCKNGLVEFRVLIPAL